MEVNKSIKMTKSTVKKLKMASTLSGKKQGVLIDELLTDFLKKYTKKVKKESKKIEKEISEKTAEVFDENGTVYILSELLN